VSDLIGSKGERKRFHFLREPILPEPSWAANLSFDQTRVLFRVNAMMPEEVAEDATCEEMSLLTLFKEILGRENLTRFEDLLRTHCDSENFVTPITIRKFYQTLGSLVTSIAGKYLSKTPEDIEPHVKRAKLRILDLGTRGHVPSSYA